MMMRGAGDGEDNGAASAAVAEAAATGDIATGTTKAGDRRRYKDEFACGCCDELFNEVKSLVEELDTAAVDSVQVTGVVTLKSSSPLYIQRVLASIAGPNVQFGQASPWVKRVFRGSEA